MKRDDILDIETQFNALEREIKNLENSLHTKDLKKFSETKSRIILIQKKIKILTA